MIINHFSELSGVSNSVPTQLPTERPLPGGNVESMEHPNQSPVTGQLCTLCVCVCGGGGGVVFVSVCVCVCVGVCLYSEFSFICHRFIRQTFNLPQFPSTKIMYK